MTDRIHSLTVVLDEDIRDDDIKPLIDAILMLRRVISVKPHVADLTSHMARERAYDHLRNELCEVLWPKEKR